MVGGNFKSVSVGGYLSNGGHGLLSAKYGLGADMVLEITLVTANGEAIVANECQNQEYFWAMRGVSPLRSEKLKRINDFPRVEDRLMGWLCPILYKAFDQGQLLSTALQSTDGIRFHTCIPNGQRLLQLEVAATSKDIQAKAV